MEELGEVLLGTYEDFIVGYRVLEIRGKSSKSSKNEQLINLKNDNLLYSFDQSFAVRCHSGSVKCLATNSKGTLAVTSGNDEMINLLSLKKRKLLHTIEVAANCATFALDSHIIFGSQDGNIYIYEYQNSSIELAKILGGHKGPVTSLSVHPSGKILLSLSSDGTMRTWNLIKGRPAYTTNFKTQAHLVSWSKSGDKFVILDKSDVYCFELSGKLKHKFSSEKRINSVDFVNENTLILASDSGYVEFIDLDKNVSLLKHQAHDTRIKSVKVLNNVTNKPKMENAGSDGDDEDDEDEEESGAGYIIPANDDDENDDGLGKHIRFVTSSSDGSVKLWSFKLNVDDEGSRDIESVQELTNTDTGSRITCMALASGSD